MKLYTRTGDDGTTGLFGGGRIAKDHPRVAAYGTVDELNASLGLALATGGTDESVDDAFFALLTTLQSRLFDLGADLATPADTKHESKIQRIDERHIKEAEDWIDQIEAGNTPMTQFILPGGTELAARLHLARTICRRAERLLVGLHRESIINPATLIYVNRVSDLLFAMARRANKEAGVADVPWLPEKT